MTKKIAYSAMLVALAMIFSYVEILIPISFGVPGIKLGLANLVVVVGLWLMPAPQVFLILVTRIILVAFMFGSMSSLLYSLAGGILSFGVMLLLKKCKGFSVIGISMAGGVSHNIGQLVIAALVVENLSVFYYFPVLMIAGLVTGMLIGVVGQRVQKRI
ncbi:MAG: Gx transporter family protein [Lachnospiraceae bacterium]|nr:Gx transporter family protein [Lachnospiraceae bacterium]